MPPQPSSGARVLSFPDDVEVGWVYCSRGGNDPSAFHAPARGTVVVPPYFSVSLGLWTPVVGLAALGASDVDSVELPKKTATDEDLLRLAHLRSLRTLHCSKDHLVTDRGLAVLAGMQDMQHLDLYATSVTDAGLAHLAGLTRLQRLHLGRTRVQGPGLASLTSLHELEWLSLEDTPLDDRSLPHLFAMPQLRTLVLYGTRLSSSAEMGLRELLSRTNVITRDRLGRLSSSQDPPAPSRH